MTKAVIGLAALAAIGYVAKSQAPELQRYLKVRQM
jgi:hypothetical protein